ncbi:cyc2-like cyclin, putative [Leishmania tarentolae]|uniref:Cyc2-like cyclin, putative n=1 Tax=Leishmania tarentolae TaxID=5689 RepID=A0A640K8S9_LEITA|nr:cyc2-like cyclin, putative [Leishmania tarentolae]
MDCVEACSPHYRRPSQLAPRSPTSVAGGGNRNSTSGGVGSSGSNSVLHACAAVSVVYSADLIPSTPPIHAESSQQPQHPSSTTTATCASAATAARASPFAQVTHHQSCPDAGATAISPPKQQQQQQQSQYVKCLSPSTCSGSVSSLTILIHPHTNASVTSAATNSSEQSTPLSGVSSHQQQVQRARARRAVDESNHLFSNLCSSLRPSLDSRSSSRARDDQVTADDAVSVALVDVVSVGGNDDGHQHQQPQPQHRRHSDDLFQCHRVRCSAPFSKRPRQPLQDRSPPPQQQQADLEDEEGQAHPHHRCGPAMHIPDPSTFVDPSASSRHWPTKTTVTASPSKEDTDPRGSRDGSSSDTNGHRDRARTLGDVEYDDQEVWRALYPPPHLRGHGGEQREGKVDPAVVTSMSSACRSAPDATPVEPPPKRFATGEGEAVALDELRYASSSSTAATDSAPSQMAGASVCINEHDVYRPHAQPLTTSEILDEGEDDEGNRASQSQPPEQRDSHTRKARVADASRSGSGVLASRRHTTDSVTAGIPYDPSHFPLPPQPPSLAPSVTAVLAAAPPVAASDHVSTGPQISTSQPSCATPPDVQQQRRRQDPPALDADRGNTSTSARPPIKLTETRYAFLALSFMMRMLCRLHKGEPIPSSDFHSHCTPPMTVTMYVQRLVRYCGCSSEALLCAFLLLLKYVFHSGHPVTIYNAHRLLITSIVLGIKLRDDVYYSNVYYGRIGGISGREMNKLELLFLDKLEWETQVHEDEYIALLDLLAELGIDAEPTSAQLEAFAAAHPDEAAAYVSDEEDNEIAEASAKLQQCTDSAADSSVKDPTATATAVPEAEQHRLKLLRGAYRLHQWHTLVVPWLSRLERCVFAKAEENAIAAAKARKEEGLRWQQYYREDEKASALRHQRPSSANTWLSPLSVEKRATSSTTAPAAAAATTGAAWASDHPYQVSWSHRDGSNVSYHSSGGAMVMANAGVHTTATSSSGFNNVRYNNFVNFSQNANGGGYFGTLSTHTSTSSAAAAAPTSVRHSSQHTIPVQSRNHSSSATLEKSASPSSHFCQSTDVPRTSMQARPHTDASASAHFDITNRATASLAVVPTSLDVSALSHQRTAPTQQEQLPSVAGTTAQLTSPSSSTTHGSGINVNAQPYYYVSSRVRKQQQQQQQASAASPASVDPSVTCPGNDLTVTDTTSTMARATAVGTDDTVAAAQRAPLSTPEGSNGARSPGSSFRSPMCVNSLARFGTHTRTSIDTVAGHASQTSGLRSGIETVVSAMKMSGLYSSGSGSNVASDSSAHFRPFPTRPIARSGVDSGNSGEQATSAHVARRSSHADHQAPVHRRSTFTSQHSLGKKRSKPDSYKDY